MNYGVEILTFLSRQPVMSEPPRWAAAVPRWQQLDPASLAVAEAWDYWSTMPQFAAPDFFIVANQAASNFSDHQFAAGGAFRPAQFVATLPSVSLSAMLQVTGWVGPMLCVQDGARTLLSGVREAALVLQSKSAATVGVMTYDLRGVNLKDPDKSSVSVRYFLIGSKVPAPRLSLKDSGESTGASSDDELEAWLSSQGSGISFMIDAGLALSWSRA